MNWQSCILPGDLPFVAKEIDASRDSLVKAVEHLLNALAKSNLSDFDESRKLVNLAIDRLEDWERSDNEMKEAFERYLADVRARRRMALVEELNK